MTGLDKIFKAKSGARVAIMVIALTMLTGCGAMRSNYIEGMPDGEREALVQKQTDDVLCRAYRSPIAHPKTLSTIGHALELRGVACTLDGEVQKIALPTDPAIPGPSTETTATPNTATPAPIVQSGCTGIAPCEEASPAENSQRLDTCVQFTLAVLNYELEERRTPGLSSTELYYRLNPDMRARVSLQDFRARDRYSQEAVSLQVLAIQLLQDAVKRKPPPSVLSRQLKEVLERNMTTPESAQTAQMLRQMGQICASRPKDK
jgi:hypothetical protein